VNREQWHLFKEAFQGAAARDAFERKAFLDEACRDDPDIRLEVEAFFVAEREMENDFLAPSITLGAAPATDDDPLVGTRVGQYRLERVLSSGGMGTVYLAEQEHPRRPVAVKVLHAGLATPSAQRRFEYESEILGTLRHPCIAQVHEAGTHRKNGGPGVPYFVMEFIPEAHTITEYARNKKLDVRARLRLFLDVCDAVHHGHRKGIIHRDLKPGNILVDAAGRIKVIDFGVARATNADVAATTMETEFGQLLGTVQYMSPEQCKADPHDLDIRSDVYALGVVLFELLCEKLPYDVHALPILDAVRRIREEQPVRPSTIVRTLRGDVETILLKALEKDRERRYQSAEELRRDIDRYLKGEPITARPPSLSYQLRTLAKRNKGIVGGIAAVFVVLAAGAITSTSLYLRSEAARSDADSARHKADDEAGMANAINDFFNRMLASVDPNQLFIASGFPPEEGGTPVSTRGLARDVSVAEMMRWASGRIGEVFAGKPELEARVRETIGTTFFGLGLYEDALPHLEIALEIRRDLFGEFHASTLRSMVQLGQFWKTTGPAASAEQVLRPALEGLRQVLGPEHRDTLCCATLLATSLCHQRKLDEGDALFEETLEAQRRALGEEDRHTLWTMCEWSFDLARRGETGKAMELASGVYEISHQSHWNPEDYITVYSESLTGLLYNWRGEFARAEKRLRSSLDKRRRILGEEHPITAGVKHFLAMSLRGKERAEERIQLQREAWEGLRRSLGEGHYWTWNAHRRLRILLAEDGRFDALEEALRDRLDSCRRTLGEEHPATNLARNDLAYFLLNRRGSDEGEAFLRDGLESSRAMYGDEHLRTLDARRDLAVFLLESGKLEEGAENLGEWVDGHARSSGEDDPSTLDAMTFAAEALFHAGQCEASRLHLERAIAGWRRRTESLAATPQDLNEYAWLLLTSEPPDLRDPRTALQVAQEAVERSGGEDPAILDTLALAWHRSGDSARAVEIQGRAIAALSPGDSDMTNFSYNLRHDLEYDMIRFLLGAGDLRGAESLADERIARARRQRGEGSLQSARPLLDDALLFADEGRFEMAEPRAREALELSRRWEISGLGQLAEAEALYGRCLAGLGRFEEAEPLLLSGFEKIGQKLFSAQAEMRHQVIGWIVDLYEAWGKPQEAALWRDR